jgi:hypothetical protein
MSVSAKVSMTRVVCAALWLWVVPRGPRRSAGRVGPDPDVHGVALVLSGVVRAVGGDPVDAEQGADEMT